MSIDLNQYDCEDADPNLSIIIDDYDGEWEPAPIADTAIRILATFIIFGVGVLAIILFLVEKMG